MIRSISWSSAGPSFLLSLDLLPLKNLLLLPLRLSDLNSGSVPVAVHNFWLPERIHHACVLYFSLLKLISPNKLYLRYEKKKLACVQSRSHENSVAHSAVHRI